MHHRDASKSCQAGPWGRQGTPRKKDIVRSHLRATRATLERGARRGSCLWGRGCREWEWCGALCRAAPAQCPCWPCNALTREPKAATWQHHAGITLGRSAQRLPRAFQVWQVGGITLRQDLQKQGECCSSRKRFVTTAENCTRHSFNTPHCQSDIKAVTG